MVTAPEQPACLHFATYEALHATLDALGHEWLMTFEMPEPRQFAHQETAVWEKQLARAIELIPLMPGEERRQRFLESATYARREFHKPLASRLAICRGVAPTHECVRVAQQQETCHTSLIAHIA